MEDLPRKATLIREIHHRVQNNLQMIVSLLRLQADQTNHPQAAAALIEAETRVRAVAHAHNRAYTTEDLTEIEFGAYLTTLAQELVSSEAKLELNVCDMVLSLEQAIPLGLIANESIVGSLKQMPADSAGTLSVTLSYIDGSYRPEGGETADDGWALLRIDAVGAGVTPPPEISDAETMSSRLIHMMARQVRGRLEAGQSPSAPFSISFPVRYR